MMRKRALARYTPALSGAATLAVFMAGVALLPSGWRQVARERTFDLVLAADSVLRKDLGASPVLVVTIDRRALATTGPWPWPRESLARLLEIIAATKPAAIAVDILFAEPDTRSPAALARRLSEVTGWADLAELAKTLVDGDQRLARAAGGVPVAFGFVLDPDGTTQLPGVRMLARGVPALSGLWNAGGAIVPRRPCRKPPGVSVQCLCPGMPTGSYAASRSWSLSVGACTQDSPRNRCGSRGRHPPMSLKRNRCD
jgi:adenylate cyclase